MQKLKPVHQTYFECSCGAEGYTQSEKEPNYCSVCGNPVYHALIEFRLKEPGEPARKPSKRKTPQKSRYKATGVPRGVKKGDFKLQHRSMHTFHMMPEEIYPTGYYYIDDYCKKAGKNQFIRRLVVRLNCGYEGQNHVARSHMRLIHGVDEVEARELCTAKYIKEHCSIVTPAKLLDNSEESVKNELFDRIL